MDSKDARAGETQPAAGRAAQRDVVVIGASAGGVEALSRVVAGLPPELPAAVFVVLHLPSSGSSVLPSILSRAGSIPVTAARDGERFERGHVYVAPPDSHMLVVDGSIRLSRGPRENGHRPAVDPLFRSAARAYAERTIGVILSGTLDDGTAGLRFLKGRGGAAVVQDPESAMYPGMPAAALAHVDVDRVVSVDDVAGAICALIDAPLANGDAARGGDTGGDPASDPDPPDLVELAPEDNLISTGETVELTCPDCGGVLNALGDGKLLRYGCQVGHTYSPDSLLNDQGQALESALWAALRTLEERADLLRRMSRRSGMKARADRFERRAGDVDDEARVVREIAMRLGRAVPGRELADAGDEAEA